MRFLLVAVLLVVGGVAVWLLGRESPHPHGNPDGPSAAPVVDARDPTFPVRPAPAGKDANPRQESPPPPRRSTRSRDRVGTGTQSATVRVLDGAGKPVAGARVVVRLRKLPLRARPPGPLSHTDETGYAKLRGLAKDQVEALLILPPPDREDVARHTLAAWAGEDTVVKLPRGHTLVCVARDHPGVPLPRATVSMRDPSGGATGYALDAEGRHRFLHLPEGWYEVRAQIGTKVGKLVRAQAGGPEVVLEIDNRGRATIQIEGWKAGAFAGRGRLWPNPLKGPNHVYLDVGTQDGTIVVQGANPESIYNLWLGTRDGKEVVFERDLRIDGREIVVKPQRAFNVSGRLIAPPGAKVTAINVLSAGVFLKGKWVGTETYEVRGLPEGTWTISAHGRCPEGRLYGYVRARAGDDADLELKVRR